MSTVVDHSAAQPSSQELVGATEWNTQTNKAFLQNLAERADVQLRHLFSSHKKYIWASDSPNFRYAFFGRDTSTVVENLANVGEYQAQMSELLMSLASYQGVRTDTMSEERPGAMPHEIRARHMDGDEVDANAHRIFDELRVRWSSNPDTETLVYYGELDGTARFVQACAALSRSGANLERHVFMHKSGEVRNLLDACGYAVDYLQDRMRESKLGLLEIQPPLNPDTLTNQTLKDSRPAYTYNYDGEAVLPNRQAPRAPLEAQILAYDALIEYADLVQDIDYERALELYASSQKLRRRVLRHFVIAPTDRRPQTYMAAMLDRDPNTRKVRQLNTDMSDPAEYMFGHFFKGNDVRLEELRHSITRTIMSPDFLTDAGCRCRSLAEYGLFGFAEYHGPLTNWVVVTHAVAKSQLAIGHPRIARELWTRMLAAVQVSGNFQEFFYVDADGNLLLRADITNHHVWRLRGEDEPQTNQAWTISACLEAIHMMQELDISNEPSSDAAFEQSVLDTIDQYRERPHELIEQLRRNTKHYHLEQVRQLAGAHEVDPRELDTTAQVLREPDHDVGHVALSPTA